MALSERTQEPPLQYLNHMSSVMGSREEVSGKMRE